jgi:pyruvate kinase
MKFRHAKIVCTLGPASDSLPMITRLMRVGMDVARLNFSHGTHQHHAELIGRLREASGQLQKPIALVADLQGPKIRTGTLENGTPITLRAGQRFTISTDGSEGTSDGVSTTYKRLPREVKRGDRILLADGLIELRVKSAGQTSIVTEVSNGGELGEHKGINLPGVHLRVPALTPKDREDLAFALAHTANYIAVSFIRRAGDVRTVRAAIKRAGYKTPIIVKLEKPEAIENLDEILTLTDAVMIARGDLGVEMSPERVPVVQKLIIMRARDARRPVITATQMLESMIENPRPTRAEASDVANAVFDGTDALMLSAETASGRYPVDAVQMMDRIITEAEANIDHYARPAPHRLDVAETTAELICHASEELQMKVIAVFTQTGPTARLVSKHRPRLPVVAFSPVQATRRLMSLYWGVLPRTIGSIRSLEDLENLAERRLLEEGLVRKGDIIGIVAGTPFGVGGSTNFMKFHVVGAPVSGATPEAGSKG